MSRRILFAINSYSRWLDNAILTRLARRHWGDSVTIYHYTTWDGVEPARFNTPETDILVVGPNSGHHNGVRDAWNDMLTHMNRLSGGCPPSCPDYPFDWVISTHCDTLWSDLSTVDRILDHCEKEWLVGACTTGGDPENGAMRNAAHMGYFCNFIALRPDVWERILPMDWAFDGDIWAEVNLRNQLQLKLGGLDKIYDIPCRSVDRLGLDTFEEVLGDPSLWFSCGHNLTIKLERFKAANPDGYAAIEDLLAA